TRVGAGVGVAGSGGTALLAATGPQDDWTTARLMPMNAISAPRTLVTHPEPQSHAALPLFTVVAGRRKDFVAPAPSGFADVRAGEGTGTILLTVNVFLLLAGYSVMKPARDGLILTEGGAELASYSAAAQGILLMILVPIYGWLGTRVVRITLLTVVTTF